MKQLSNAARKNYDYLPEYKSIEQAYAHFILEKKHPCIMAKTVFKMEDYTLKIYDHLDNPDSQIKLLDDLAQFIHSYDFESNRFESFIASFPAEEIRNEQEFEQKLWNFLQALHELDSSPWDPTVSADPSDPNFSFSLNNKAFYIVGLHPKSSRIARQSPYVTIVFNLHWQFEKLREMGTYKKVKKRIRKRDKKLQGTINPVLKDFGNDTETKQYSGRAVEPEWKCPFHPKPTTL